MLKIVPQDTFTRAFTRSNLFEEPRAFHLAFQDRSQSSSDVPSLQEEELLFRDMVDEDLSAPLDPAGTRPTPESQHRAAELSMTLKEIAVPSPSGSQRSVSLPKVKETS